MSHHFLCLAVVCATASDVSERILRRSVKLADAGGGFCRVENETDIFDYQLTLHTIKTLEQAKATGKPFMIFAGYKKASLQWHSLDHLCPSFAE